MKTRRAVIGLDSQGHSSFVSDTVIEATSLPASSFVSILKTNSPIVIPTEGVIDDSMGFPAVGETWSFVWAVPPHTAGGEQSEDDRPTQAGELPSGGIHATDSLDIDIVLSGEITLELGDGDSRVFGQGDVVVMNGVAHAWRNDGDTEAKIFTIVLGGSRQ